MAENWVISSLRRLVSSRAAALSLAVGFVLASGALAYFAFYQRPQPRKPTLTVSILSHEALLDLLRTIRARHSMAYRALAASSRTKRRKHPRNSEAYRHCILQFNTKSRALLREVSKTVIREYSLTDALVLASCAFYEGDDDIEEAKSKLGVLINDTKLPKELDLEKAREIFLFCREKSMSLMEDSFGDFVVQGVALEDELWERYGFEMEQIEKAYEKYKRELHHLETQMKLQGSGYRRGDQATDDGSEAM